MENGATRYGGNARVTAANFYAKAGFETGRRNFQ